MSTAKDQFGRPTVLDLIHDIPQRIYPVGRLDYDTAGLIILTNDGDFAYRLLHPSHEVPKTYVATVSGTLTEIELKSLCDGVKIEDYITSPAVVKVVEISSSQSIIEITIREGRNRQVRKMAESLGHTVLKLTRISIGGVLLGELHVGKWRKLSQVELDSLQKLGNPMK